MDTRERPSPVDLQLQAYRESWQRDHDAAMVCRDWEDIVAVGINTGRLLLEREQTWREHVFRGTLPFSPDDESEQRARFTLWLSVTEAILRDIVPILEREFTVEGTEQLRQCAAEVQRSLARWESPRLSAAVGLREMTLSREAAVELNRLIEEARSKTPEIPSAPAVKEMSAEEFLRRKRAKTP